MLNSSTFSEKGNFLALDLGGTNFRVLLITLDGQSFDMKSKIYAIPQSLMLGTGRQLFDHIAQCLALFVKDLKLEQEVLPLGFTFSFPLSQQGLTEGLLVRWTKGFNCSGVVEQDVVALLEEAIARRNVSLILYISRYRFQLVQALLRRGWREREKRSRSFLENTIK